MKQYVFCSKNRRLQVVVGREQYDHDQFGRLVVLPCRMVQFEDGRFITEEEAVANALRASSAFRDGSIFEITDKDRDAVRAGAKGQGVRGDISQATFAKEVNPNANVPEPKTKSEEPKPETGVANGTPEPGAEGQVNPFETGGGQAGKTQGPTTKCEVCGKVFENDLTGRKLRMHMVSHARSEGAKGPAAPPRLAEEDPEDTGE